MKMNQRGFTLIEVMIVVAIMGILASVAYSSYQSQIQQSRRAQGTQALLETAQVLERCATENLSYEAAGCSLVLPFNAPRDSADKYYTISIANRTATTYTLTATSINAQAGDADCAVINITHLGVKTATTANCW